MFSYVIILLLLLKERSARASNSLIICTFDSRSRKRKRRKLLESKFLEKIFWQLIPGWSHLDVRTMWNYSFKIAQINNNKVSHEKKLNCLDMEGEKILMAVGATAAMVTAAFVFWGPTGLHRIFSLLGWWKWIVQNGFIIYWIECYE